MNSDTDTAVATPIEPNNRCSNSSDHGTVAGYFLVCDFSTNTVQLLIQSPVQGDVYYCKGATESQRTTVSVAGMYVYILSRHKPILEADVHPQYKHEMRVIITTFEIDFLGV